MIKYNNIYKYMKKIYYEKKHKKNKIQIQFTFYFLYNDNNIYVGINNYDSFQFVNQLIHY
jgi:hypothetical protein